MSAFRKAERKRAKARIALCGPSGSGKTYTALLIAEGIGGRIAMIDTERGSGELYSHLCEYDVASLDGNYDPAHYIQLIKDAEAAGYDTIIIDSLTHAWEGEGGILHKHDLASKKTYNSFTAWRDITPQHNALVDAMLQSRCHIIATMRTKTHYDMVEEQNSKGQKTVKPVKVGLKPVQREGMDYEFTIVFDLTQDGHVASASKDRTGLFDGNPHIPSLETGQRIVAWLNSGVIDLTPKPQPAFQPASTPEPAQPAAVPSLKVQFDAEIRKYQEVINERLIDANYAPLTDVQKYRVEIGQWIRQTPFGQLTPELLEWIRNDDEAFVQDFSTFILSKQPAEAAV